MTALLVLLFAMLAGCGGGGSDDDNQPRQGAIGCYGDSILYTECDALGRLGVKVRNLADGGGRLAEFAAATGRYSLALESDDAVAVIAFGTNEARRFGAADNQSPDQFEQTLRMVVRGLQSTGKRVVLETPPVLLTDRRAEASEYGRRVRIIAAELSAQLCDREQAFPGADSDDIPDMVHPGPEMTAANARSLKQCVELSQQ
ncbi:MAG TPA: SGNH/GDSL hydrolase family protein [Burkholderiaceae bacterium]|nr:SGNH/GDSL hydrolase family protein [Burkholderiaceae bacterium]